MQMSYNDLPFINFLMHAMKLLVGKWMICAELAFYIYSAPH